MAVIANDVNSFDDIGVFQGRADAKLGSDLFLILFFCLSTTLGSELLDGEDIASILAAGLY